MNQDDGTAAKRRMLVEWFAWSAAHYVVLLGLAGVIFLVSHIPPKAVNLDAVYSSLVGIETILVGPRKLLLAGWPFEATPTGFGLLLTVVNSMAWGYALRTFFRLWQRFSL